MTQQNPVQRAFELARSGECRSVEDVRRRLKAERFENVDGHISGPTIKRQLMEAMRSPG